jgi:hypothetical protein
LIQNSEQDVIDLVRSLVSDHIQGEDTLILITIPMSGKDTILFSSVNLTLH